MLDGRVLLAQDSDVAPGEERGDGSLGVRPELVIAQAAVNSEGCLQLRDHLHHRILSPGIPGDEVACDGDEVGVKLIGERDVSANFVGGHERTDVKVGKLRDAESLKAFRQARQVNAPLGDLEIRAAVERAVGPRHKRNGGAEERRLLEKLPTCRGLGSNCPIPLGDSPRQSVRGAHHTVTHPEETNQYEAEDRAEQPYLERRVEQGCSPSQLRGIRT